MSEKRELKHSCDECCPWCKSKKLKVESIGFGSKACYVRCMDCFAQGPVSGPYEHTVWFTHESDARKKWDARQPTSAGGA